MTFLFIVQVKSKLRGHSKRITGLAFSNVLNVLVSSGADAQVIYWTVKLDHIWKLLILYFTFFTIISSFIQLCVWNTDGWEKQKNRFLQIPSGRPSNILDTRVQFHQDQMHFLVVHETQIAIYDTTKLEPVKQVNYPPPRHHPTPASFLLFWITLAVEVNSPLSMKVVSFCIYLLTVACSREFTSNNTCDILVW